MSWLKFEIPLTPKIKKNSRPIYRNKKTGKPFLGKSEGLHEYERDAILVLQSQRSCSGLREPLSGRLEAKFIFEFKLNCPADGDNLLGTAQDVAVKARIIEDDKMLKRVEFSVVENTGRPDRTVLYFRKISIDTRHKVTHTVSAAEARLQLRSLLK